MESNRELRRYPDNSDLHMEGRQAPNHFGETGEAK